MASNTPEDDQEEQKLSAYRNPYQRRRIRNEVQQNIQSIMSCLRAGDDQKAEKYLEDIVNKQVQRHEEEYAVKTLCNIARRAKNLLRYGFEKTCLDAALGIRADARAYIQLGDHYKRTGSFSAATDAFRLAMPLAEGEAMGANRSGIEWIG